MEASRGSEHILAKLLGSTKAPTKEELTKLVEATRASGYHIVDWHTKGIPAIDFIRAELETTKEQAPEAVKELLGAHGHGMAVSFNIFPKGIPVFDRVRIEVIAEKASQ